MRDTRTFTLLLEVEYAVDDDTISPSVCETLLQDFVDFGLNRGLLTGETPYEVDGHTARIVPGHVDIPQETT